MSAFVIHIEKGRWRLMPKARSPERDRAYEIYKESNGLITLREIASRLGVPEKSVSGWKCKDSWDKKINGVLQSNIRSTPKRKNVAKKIIEDVENNEELNDRERLFIFAYLETHNAKISCLRAGYDVQERYARQLGYKILNRHRVKLEIERLKKIRNEAMFLSSEDVLEKYMQIAFADITDFIELSGSGECVNIKSLDKLDGGVIESIKNDKFGISLKLSNRNKALAFLAKYFEMNPMDKHRKEYDNKRLELERVKRDDSNGQQSNGSEGPSVVFYLPDNGRGDNNGGVKND